MKRPSPAVTTVAAVLLALTACSDSVRPPQVASVAVVSPSGNRLALGKSLQLSAEARDAAGDALPGKTMLWASSAPEFAEVNSATGMVQGLKSGSTTISATTGGIAGNFLLTIVQADLEAIAAARGDSYLAALVAGLTTPVRTRVQTAFAQCSSGLGNGSVTEIEECIADVRAEHTAATDGTDKALLASLVLFVDHFESLLGI